MKKRTTKKKESSELNQPIWAIIDGVNILASELRYSDAVSKVAAFSGNGTIVTQEVAVRLAGRR